jgi:hypothetical protein
MAEALHLGHEDARRRGTVTRVERHSGAITDDEFAAYKANLLP